MGNAKPLAKRLAWWALSLLLGLLAAAILQATLHISSQPLRFVGMAGIALGAVGGALIECAGGRVVSGLLAAVVAVGVFFAAGFGLDGLRNAGILDVEGLRIASVLVGAGIFVLAVIATRRMCRKK